MDLDLETFLIALYVMVMISTRAIFGPRCPPVAGP